MTQGRREWQAEADRLAKEAIAAGRPTGWFDELYSEAVAGRLTMPWDRTDPHPILTRWADEHDVAGAGRRAIVVGCGLGADVAFLAERGFESTGFDISDTAIQLATERHGHTGAQFTVADLFALPDAWVHGYDLVVEVFTVQALPDPRRAEAIAQVGRLVAPGGTLVAVEFRNQTEVAAEDGPPWPIRHSEMARFATDGLDPRGIEAVSHPAWPDATFWLAEFTRPKT